MTERLSLRDLDRFYRENEIPLDDFMRGRSLSWHELSYDRKLAIWGAFQGLQARPAARTPGVNSAAEAFHAIHREDYGKTAAQIYLEQQGRADGGVDA